MAANRTIKVDVWSKIRERITVVQREILGRSLTFQLYSGATPINLTGGTVTLYAILPDNMTEIFNACTLTTPASGICTYTFTEATLLQAGDLRCWLIYVDSSANELRTQEFAIEVQASPDFTSSVEGTSEYNAFSTALSTYSGIDARVADIEDTAGVVKCDGSGGFSVATAADLAIADTASRYTGTNVETALAEIAGSGRTTETVKSNATAIANIVAAGLENPFTAMPYVGTAPVVESGSNANGHYIKFADGTMICRGSPTLSSLAITTASGAVYTGTATYTLPAEFYAVPAVVVTFDGGNYVWTSVNPATTTTIAIIAYSSISQTTSTGVFHYIAVGRWKA